MRFSANEFQSALNNEFICHRVEDARCLWALHVHFATFISTSMNSWFVLIPKYTLLHAKWIWYDIPDLPTFARWIRRAKLIDTHQTSISSSPLIAEIHIQFLMFRRNVSWSTCYQLAPRVRWPKINLRPKTAENQEIGDLQKALWPNPS